MRTDYRKIFSFGRYSLALLLPKKWLNELSVEPGDYLHLEFDSGRKWITVRSDNQSSRKRTSQTKKATLNHTSPQTTSKTDSAWEPIPQL